MTTTAVGEAGVVAKLSNRQKRRLERTVVSPKTLNTTLGVYFQLSCHKVPRLLVSECELVFPCLTTQIRMEENDVAASELRRRQLLCIPTFHRAAFDILERNRVTEDERARVYMRFERFARAFKDRMLKRDSLAFVDWVGLHGCASDTHGGQAIYDEVMSAKSLCGYRLTSYCGVSIVDHPVVGYRDLTVHSIVCFANHFVTAEILNEMAAGGYTFLEEESDHFSKSAVLSKTDDRGSSASDIHENTYSDEASQFVATAKLACGEGAESFEKYKHLQRIASGKGIN